MNWEAFAAVSEGLGAMGVIASLLYLATQVRTNTRASRVEAKLAATNYLASYTDRLIDSPRHHELFLRGRKSLDGLDRMELVVFSTLCLKAFWYFSASHFQLRQGMLSEEEWYEGRAVLHYYLRGPGVQAWWQQSGAQMFAPPFRTFIETEARSVARDAGEPAAVAGGGAEAAR